MMQLKPSRLRRSPLMRLAPRPPKDPQSDVPLGAGGAGFLRPVRAVRRLITILLWTLLAIPTQALFLVLPGRMKVRFARIYWSWVSRALGIKVRVIGKRIRGRPVVYVSNHSSWLDIPILGGRLEACFVSKEEVGTWPVVRTIARLGRTVFVSRNRSSTIKERDDMIGRLASGDSLILFPEGTSSNGARVLPFRTPFFAIVDAADEPPVIQPVSIVYDRLGGLPCRHATRPVFAWYGDMDLASHFWQLAKWQGLRATILLHEPIDPKEFRSRKALAQECWNTVAEGAATLRQNRPVNDGARRVPAREKAVA